MNEADFEIIERDMAEIEAMKNDKLLKVLKEVHSELIAFMLGEKPSKATSETFNKLQAIIEELR